MRASMFGGSKRLYGGRWACSQLRFGTGKGARSCWPATASARSRYTTGIWLALWPLGPNSRRSCRCKASPRRSTAPRSPYSCATITSRRLTQFTRAWPSCPRPHGSNSRLTRCSAGVGPSPRLIGPREKPRRKELHARLPLAPIPKRRNSLEAMLEQAIAGQVVADVPVGAFLSGGVNSSKVVALMQRRSSRRVKTFTIGFNEDAYNEAAFAEARRPAPGHGAYGYSDVSPQEALNVISKAARNLLRALCRLFANSNVSCCRTSRASRSPCLCPGMAATSYSAVTPVTS